MIPLIPLLLAAALVGILHMSAPDHWVTLCLLGRSANWSRQRLFGVSLATAIGHVIFSVLLGLCVVVVGLVFSTLISSYLSEGIGSAMFVIGLIIGIRALISKKEEITPEEDLEIEEEKLLQHEHNHKGLRGVGYFAVLGAALSPDLSITPVFLSAIPAGIYFALELSLVFALASILCLLALVQVGTMGLAKAFENIPEKYNDSIVGFVIAAIGIYIIVVG